MDSWSLSEGTQEKEEQLNAYEYDNSDREPGDPTPEEIAAMCQEIQAGTAGVITQYGWPAKGWTESTRRQRAGLLTDTFRIPTYVRNEAARTFETAELKFPEIIWTEKQFRRFIKAGKAAGSGERTVAEKTH